MGAVSRQSGRQQFKFPAAGETGRGRGSGSTDNLMAFISHVPESALAPSDRVADSDNIIQIHAVHPQVMRQHYELYRQLMHGDGPLSRRERELMGVRVSALNHCHY